MFINCIGTYSTACHFIYLSIILLDVTTTSQIRKYAEHEPENQIDMGSTLTSSSRTDTPNRSQNTSKNDIFGKNKGIYFLIFK